MRLKGVIVESVGREELRRIVVSLEVDGADRRSANSMRAAVGACRRATAESLLDCLGSRGYNRHFSRIREMIVPRPPLPEQRAIARVLRTVQRAKETESGELPSTWVAKRFDEFATLQRGQDLPRWDFKDGQVPVVGATSVIGYHDTANVKGPGVTVVRSGSSVGKPLYVDRDFWAHNVVLYVKDIVPSPRSSTPSFTI